MAEVILRRKHNFKRNLGKPVKNCLKVYLINLSESIRRGLILMSCNTSQCICTPTAPSKNVQNLQKNKIMPSVSSTSATMRLQS